MPRPPLRDAQGVAHYRHEAIAVVLQVRGMGTDARLGVFAWQRRRDPYQGLWALPSGPVEVDETLDQCVQRHLAAKLDLDRLLHLEQLETLSDPGRDPWERTIATAYLALEPWDPEPAKLSSASWFPLDALPPLAFDHARIVAAGVERLRNKLSYTNLGFALAPGEFTLAGLRDIYAAALGYGVSVTNLQRILVRRGQLEPTGEISATGPQGGRPARLFRFTDQSLTVTDPFAVLKP